MQYVRLGSTGTKVSELCFGTWRFGKESDGTVETDRSTAHELLDTFEAAGGNFIDTANVYGDPTGTAEEWIGDWLAGRDRQDFVLASKVYFGFDDGPNDNGLSRTHIRQQIRGTLERLGVEYLDVYYIHRWDDDVPIKETLTTLNDLVREGKVNYLAASSMAAWQLTKALWQSDVDGLERFEVTQPRFNAAYRDPVADYLDVCADQDLAVCPYSPLEGGFLTGKYDRAGQNPEGSRGDLYEWDERFGDEQWAVLSEIRQVADEEDTSESQVALRWLADQPNFQCIPIVGARTVGQLEENLGMVDVSLSESQFERIQQAYE